MLRVHAPELAPFEAWINTARPLSMRALRGQLVVLDFFTSCCVNCMHVAPILRELERRHEKDPLVVIGVHSAKFPGEAPADRVIDAVERYGIEHPVVVDQDLAIWHAFAVRSWPTLVFVRPDGTIAAVAPGEPDPVLLESFVQQELAAARANGTLAKEPFHWEQARRAHTGPLSFPSKIAVAKDGRVAISDSGHDRVLVIDTRGRVQHCIGSGGRGHADGTFDQALFDDPQGLLLEGDVLWVCDARNHCIRRIDLRARRIETVAGTGRMGTVLPDRPAAARSAPLRSPWAIVRRGDELLFAMAGTHQLWAFDEKTAMVRPWAGSGREALVDGPLMQAAFAQPSGLALDGDTLYVADSETSAVRAIDCAKGEVRTLAGVSLFDFGDTDGPLEEARFQHPLGVASDKQGGVLVADTLNDRIRRIDTTKGVVETFYVGEGDRELREPSEIVRAPHHMGGWLVVDSSGHRIVRLDDSGAWAGIFTLKDVPIPRTGGRAEPEAVEITPGSAAAWFNEVLAPSEGSSFAPGEITLTIALHAPAGWKLATGSTARAALEVSRRSDLLELTHAAVGTTVDEQGRAVLRCEGSVSKLPDAEVPSEVLVVLDAMVCGEGDTAVCAPTRSWLRVPVVLARSGGAKVGYAATVAKPVL